ncbi:MAG: hypothetical protein ACJA2X_000501 [Halocynthiibacter sp.]|jgi:hypothetical protein
MRDFVKEWTTVQTEHPKKITSAVATIGMDAIFALMFLKSLIGGRELCAGLANTGGSVAVILVPFGAFRA